VAVDSDEPLDATSSRIASTSISEGSPTSLAPLTPASITV
jgi:hypothetical protein